MPDDIILKTDSVKRSFVTNKFLFGAPTEVYAVDGVDIAISRGETFAIVGESGCGKSTLARLLISLIAPTSGKVIYDGADTGKLDAEELRRLRREMQFIFQDPFSSLNPRMTVGALVAEPLKTHGIGSAAERRNKVIDLLGKVGLGAEHAGRYPHEFSGGQRQRIGIARALATQPKILIGDEPVSALDVSIQAQVINILEDLKEEFGLTLIIIAHDLAVVRHMADTIAVMYLGEIVEIGPADAIFGSPRHPYTEALLAAIPIPAVRKPRARITVKGDPPNPINPPSGCRFHPRCPYATEECRTRRPHLRKTGKGQQAACHLAGEISLNGVSGTGSGRKQATKRRFRHYNEASAAMANTPPNNSNEATNQRKGGKHVFA